MNSALHWDTEQVSKWLAQIFSDNNILFQNLAAVVHEQDIDGEVLFELNEEHLEQLFYITALGKKIRILKAIRGLKSPRNNLVSHSMQPSVQPPISPFIQPVVPQVTHLPTKPHIDQPTHSSKQNSMVPTMPSSSQFPISHASQLQMPPSMPRVAATNASIRKQVLALPPSTKDVIVVDSVDDDISTSSSPRNISKNNQGSETTSLNAKDNVQTRVSTRDNGVNNRFLSQSSMAFPAPRLPSPPPKRHHSSTRDNSVNNSSLPQNSMSFPAPRLPSPPPKRHHSSTRDNSVNNSFLSEDFIPFSAPQLPSPIPNRPHITRSLFNVENLQPQHITRPELPASSQGVFTRQPMTLEDLFALFQR